MNEKTTKKTKKQEALIDSIQKSLSRADKIVVGAGSGLSASAGLDYKDPSFFASRYRPFLKTSSTTVSEAIRANQNLNKENAPAYWGFWAYHIHNILYQQEQMEVYKILFETIRAKDYFVVTSNTDGQFFKGLYDPSRIFTPQGSYALFQCKRGCHPTLYDNKKTIKQMLQHFDQENLSIREKDIPHCPTCGGLLCPNLRVDQYFIESPLSKSSKGYRDFINITDEKIVFLELGMEGDSPFLFREPFEEMTKLYKNATLIRINTKKEQAGETITDKSFMLNMGILDFLRKLNQEKAE